mmetsp:Transcript_35179/g.80236  ORF Transcript_35179/g.80236 Transcript_35179/m.80236 type:complete len:707 (+) Transcript_35179:58-2178(+)
MAQDSLADSLVSWINTFELSKSLDRLEDLADGIVAHEILRQIAPPTFELAALKTEGMDNSLLRVSNMKKVVKDVDHFFHTILRQRVCVDDIDVSALARDGDQAAAVKLAELLLGCAVQCEKKQEYVQNIMGLDSASQAQLMTLIQKILSSAETRSPERRPTSGSVDSMDGDFSLGTSNTPQVYSPQTGPMDEPGKSSKALELKVMELEQEKTELATVVGQLKAELQQLQADHTASMEEKTALARQLSSMGGASKASSQAQRLSEELQARVQELEQENADLQARLPELEKLVPANRALQDELDVLKHTVEGASALEQQVIRLKKKLEATEDLRRELQAVSETNAQYLEQNLDLEEQIAKMDKLKEQMETYKDKVASLETERMRLKNSLEEKQEELDQISKSHTDLQAEYKTLQSLRKEKAADDDDEPATPQLGGGGLGLGGAPAELQKKLARLERENKALKEKSAGSGDSALESQLDDLQRLNKAMEQDYKESRARVKELEGEVKSLKAASGGAAPTSPTSPEAMDKLKAEIQRLRNELKKAQAGPAVAAPAEGAPATGSSSKDEEIAKLREEVAKEREQIQNLKAKFTVSHAEQSRASEVKRQEFDLGVATLEKRLLEKTEEADIWKSKMRKALDSHEREQRLISAWIYDLEMELQRTKMVQRSALENSSSRSWLGRKRQDFAQDSFIALPTAAKPSPSATPAARK